MCLLLTTASFYHSKVESTNVTVTSARPSAELSTLPSDDSLRKDIPIPAKNFTAEAEEPVTSVVKSDDVKADIESKLLNFPPRFNIVKSQEDRKRMVFLYIYYWFSLFFLGCNCVSVTQSAKSDYNRKVTTQFVNSDKEKRFKIKVFFFSVTFIQA